MAALPISGIDGCLKQRMRENGMKGRVRAKTGTMTGITALSGYVTSKDGEPLAFSIMINGFVKPTKEYEKQIEDQICILLSEFTR